MQGVWLISSSKSQTKCGCCVRVSGEHQLVSRTTQTCVLSSFTISGSAAGLSGDHEKQMQVQSLTCSCADLTLTLCLSQQSDCTHSALTKDGQRRLALHAPSCAGQRSKILPLSMMMFIQQWFIVTMLVAITNVYHHCFRSWRAYRVGADGDLVAKRLGYLVQSRRYACLVRNG